MDKKKQIKLGIIVVGLVAAVTITLLSNLSDSAADAEESGTLWKCTACLKTFKLTAREAERAQDISGGVPILCPVCDKVRAYQVMACPKCGTLFFGSEVPGHNGQCPTCLLAAKKAKKKQKVPNVQEVEEEPPDEKPAAKVNEPQMKPTTKKVDRKETKKDEKKKKAKKKLPKKKKKKKPAPKSL